MIQHYNKSSTDIEILENLLKNYFKLGIVAKGKEVYSPNYALSNINEEKYGKRTLFDRSFVFINTFYWFKYLRSVMNLFDIVSYHWISQHYWEEN